MEFEYDENKSQSNKRKHGINFEEAKALWDDQERLEIPTNYMDEDRSIVIGTIGKRHWTAVITYRKKSVRLISVRRARKEEVALYESI